MLGSTGTELFRWPSAALYLLDGDERALLQRGSFTLFLAMHCGSPHLVAVEATVGEVQWPIGKDCEVACFKRDKAHLFTFTLRQGLVYELVLDEKGDGFQVHMDRLEQLFRLYANVKYSGNKALDEQNARKYWMEKTGTRERSCDYSRVTSSTAAAEIDTEVLQLTLAGAVGGGRTSQSAHRMQIHDKTSNEIEVAVPGASRRIMKRMNQARRISAVAKLFSKALARGAIRPERHIECAMPAQRQGGSMAMVPAVADVDMVAKVVELVEKRTTLGEAVKQEKTRLRGSWTLNEVGLHLLLKAVVAANMIATSQTQ